MHAQVKAAESYGYDEHGRGNYDLQAPSPAFDPGRTDDVREHSVSDERSKRMTAREAECFAVKECCSTGRPRPVRG